MLHKKVIFIKPLAVDVHKAKLYAFVELHNYYSFFIK